MAKKRRNAQPPVPIPPPVPRRARLGTLGVAFAALLIGCALAWWGFAKRGATPAASTAPLGEKSSASPAPRPSAVLSPLLDPEEKVFASYAGSQSCRDCH